MRMLHDPLPEAIENSPSASSFKPGWLESYREAWHLLPPPRSTFGSSPHQVDVG
jgi:hypothetical protein